MCQALNANNKKDKYFTFHNTEREKGREKYSSKVI